MKLLIFIITYALFSVTSSAQKLSYSLSTGSGKSYIIEGISRNTNARYGIPGSFISSLKFIPKDNSSWGVVLMMQHVTTTVSGSDVITNIPLNGYVSTFTTSLLLEKELYRKSNSSWGFNIGIGITKETIRPQRIVPTNTIENTYPSINLSTFWAYKLSSQFDFLFSPIIMWHDPAKSISYLAGKGGNLADEDISAFLHFGIRYHIL